VQEGALARGGRAKVGFRLRGGRLGDDVQELAGAALRSDAREERGMGMGMEEERGAGL